MSGMDEFLGGGKDYHSAGGSRCRSLNKCLVQRRPLASENRNQVRAQRDSEGLLFIVGRKERCAH
jgi:hypothetical protein